MPKNQTRRPGTDAFLSGVRSALRRLEEVRDEGMFMAESPIEVQFAIDAAIHDLEEVVRFLKERTVETPSPGPATRGGPTRQQGQFLAYIREYMLRNEAGLAPTHAVLQRFFELTPPSVSSMLGRLEKAGFLRRVPRRNRAIELTIDPTLVPALERRFTS